jgi:Gpi18-like mannosyltransferase
MKLRMHHFFLITAAKLFILFIVGACASFFIPYAGRFPYRELLNTFNVPYFVSVYANFDGLHYILIATQGYSQYEQAFFPLYPLLIHHLGYITFNNYFVSGFLISYAAFSTGLIFFYKLMHHYIGKKTNYSLLALILFPTAFFFHAVYTEGLFFLLFFGTLFFFSQKKYTYAALFAFFASLTRLVGVFLIIPFLIHIIEHFVYKKKIERNMLIWAAFPIIGLLFYMGYLWQTTGDPLFFFNAQPSFGANRSTSIILLPQVYFRYVKIFLFSNIDVAYFVAAVETFLFTAVFGLSLVHLWQSVKQRQAFLLSLSLISLANILLPTLTGTFSSIPRYALFSPSFFMVISSIKLSGLKTGWLILSLILQLILFVLFVQGYFVS